MNFARRLSCLLVAVTCLLAGAWAQVQTSELHVIAKDPKGALVSGATVTAAEPGKGVSRTATTNAEGAAILLSLPPGLYSVTVEAPGFAKLVNSSVRLTIGQVAELPVQLTVAATTETVNSCGRSDRRASVYSNGPPFSRGSFDRPTVRRWPASVPHRKPTSQDRTDQALMASVNNGT